MDFPAASFARSVTDGWFAVSSSESPASESESLLSESDGGSGIFWRLARLWSIKHTTITLHAFDGSRRKPQRRQCHLFFATPMHRSTVDRVELCAKLYCLSLLFEGLLYGVMSHECTIYPLSPRNMPSIGGRLLSDAANSGDSRSIRASCTEPGYLAMTFMKSRSASHITCKDSYVNQPKMINCLEYPSHGDVVEQGTRIS